MLALDSTYEPRLWRCDECRYILGVVMRDTNHVRRLFLFRLQRWDTNLPTTQVLHNPPRGLYSVHGIDYVSRPGGVECMACGALTDWSMSQEAFDKLISNYNHDKRV